MYCGVFQDLKSILHKHRCVCVCECVCGCVSVVREMRTAPIKGLRK